MNSRAAYDTIDAILNVHSMVNGFVAQAVEDVPDSRMAEQPAGGLIVNHPAWTLSHLNAYAGLLLSMLEDTSVSAAAVEAEMARFGFGTTPVPDLGAYAPKHELVERFKERNARLGAVVAAKHGEMFPRPAPERFRTHAPTIGHIAVTLLVAHPAHHLGQLRQWRRGTGIAGG
ncbi:MAG TPA: DinB family protein [Phycisphaerales bacterium]|nr:DinB family protein [Phycisphaerales bacterium]